MSSLLTQTFPRMLLKAQRCYLKVLLQSRTPEAQHTNAQIRKDQLQSKVQARTALHHSRNCSLQQSNFWNSEDLQMRLITDRSLWLEDGGVGQSLRAAAVTAQYVTILAITVTSLCALSMGDFELTFHALRNSSRLLFLKKSPNRRRCYWLSIQNNNKKKKVKDIDIFVQLHDFAVKWMF